MTARSRRTRSTGGPSRPGARIRSVLSEGTLPVHVDNRTPDSLVPHRSRGPTALAVLIERTNRFLAVCRLAGRRGPSAVVRAHVPDRGRCLDLLVPGQPLVL